MKQAAATLKAWLEKAIAATGPFDPAALFIGVYTAITDNGQDTVQADVTEGTGALATRVAVTPWSAVYKLADGRWCADGPLCTFSPASAAEAQTVAGWFLNSAAAAGTLKAFEPLPSARPLPDENADLKIIPRLTIDPDGRFSVTAVLANS